MPDAKPPFYMKILGYPLTFIGGIGVFTTINNIITDHRMLMPGPIAVGFAAIVFAGGLTLLRAKPSRSATVPKGAELTPNGDVSFDRQILQAVRAQDGKATIARTASILGISEDIALRELRILAEEGACRVLEDGTFYFAEFADEEKKRAARAVEERR